MWDDGVTWLLGFLAIAVSAGWLAGRRTKSLGRLRSEAELLANMHEGPARQALEAHISTSVMEYLRVRKEIDRVRTQWMIAGIVQVVAVVLLVVAEVAGAGIASDWDDAPTWGVVVALTGTTLLAGAILWETVLMFRQRHEIRQLLEG